MQSNGRTPVGLWASIAGLLVINSITLILLLWQYSITVRQRAEIARQRSEVEALQAQHEKLLQQAADSRLPTVRVIPPGVPGAFGRVKESDIPGRYKWFDNDNERGIITLNVDHTFIGERGQRNPTYRWALSPDQLVLEYNRMTGYYTNVESPGVYVGVRTDRKGQRLERVE